MEPAYESYMDRANGEGGRNNAAVAAAPTVRIAGDATPDYIWANLR